MKKYLILILSLFMFSCSPPIKTKHPPHNPSFQPKSPFDSCKFEKIKTVPMLVSVAFFTECGTIGVRLFAITVFDDQNMALAGTKAAQIIKEELGYRPILALVGKFGISDKYGVTYPMLIFIKTGRVNE